MKIHQWIFLGLIINACGGNQAGAGAKTALISDSAYGPQSPKIKGHCDGNPLLATTYLKSPTKFSVQVYGNSRPIIWQKEKIQYNADPKLTVKLTRDLIPFRLVDSRATPLANRNTEISLSYDFQYGLANEERRALTIHPGSITQFLLGVDSVGNFYTCSLTSYVVPQAAK